MGHNLTEEAVEEVIGRTAGDVPEPGETSSEGSPEEPTPQATPEPTGEDAIAFIEMVNVGVVVGVSKLRRIDLSKEVMELTRFTEQDKEQLRPYAPYAAPYLHKMAEHSEKFMALVFCGIGVMTIGSRMKTLAEIQQKQIQTKDEEKVMNPNNWKPAEEETPWKAGEST